MPVRRFVDRQGVAWDVWHTIPSQPSFLAPELAAGWLTFSSPHERRRLAPAPLYWESADPDRLDALCRSAEVVRF